MKKRIFWTTLFLTPLLHVLLMAQPGTTGLSFLKLGVGGRALAMGEAYSALATDPSATYYNPAALSLSESSQLLLMHREWFQGVKTEFISGSTSLNKWSFGIGVNETSIGDIEVRSVPGPALETFTARNASLGISAAYQLDPSFSIGMTGKILYEQILIYDASGYALDFGGVYTSPWNIRFAAVVNNIGSMDALDQEESTLPTSVRAGAAYSTLMESVEGVLTVSSDIVAFTGESTTHLHIGAELELQHAVALRGGYQSGYDAKNFSGGLGVHYGLLRVDYAFVPFRYDLGSTHTFSLGIAFN